MESAEQRIENALKHIDALVEDLVHRPGMMTGSHLFGIAELMLTHILSVRADLVGADYDYKAWCLKKYPETPGPVRCIAYYLNSKWDGYDPGFEPDFGQKNDDWIKEASEFVEYAMAEMSKGKEG